MSKLKKPTLGFLLLNKKKYWLFFFPEAYPWGLITEPNHKASSKTQNLFCFWMLWEEGKETLQKVIIRFTSGRKTETCQSWGNKAPQDVHRLTSSKSCMTVNVTHALILLSADIHYSVGSSSVHSLCGKTLFYIFI